MIGRRWNAKLPVGGAPQPAAMSALGKARALQVAAFVWMVWPRRGRVMTWHAGPSKLYPRTETHLDQ